MRICFATSCYKLPDAPIGGLPIHYELLAKGLVKRDHKVTVLYCDRFGYTSSKEWQGNLSFIPVRFSTPKLFHKRFIGGIINKLGISEYIRFRMDSRHIIHNFDRLHARTPFDIVESPNNGATLAAYHSRARPPTCIRIATTDKAHTTSNTKAISSYHRHLFKAEGASFRQCPNLVTHTLSHRDLICKEYNLSPERFTLIPLSVPIPDKSKLLKTKHVRSITVLFVGRFELRKGIDVLLEAIPKAIKQCPNLKFRLVGPDPQNSYQKSFEKKHTASILKKVLFLGEKTGESLEDEYRNCDFFVAPSRYESFGLIFAEAMSFGKAVIGTRAGGIPEVVEDGATGILCPPDSPNSLVDAIVQLASSASKREEMGREGRKSVINKFSLSNLIRQTENYYRRLASAAQPATQ